jgi:formylglycine-generating enzyme required for sulfatase activity
MILKIAEFSKYFKDRIKVPAFIDLALLVSFFIYSPHLWAADHSVGHSVNHSNKKAGARSPQTETRSRTLEALLKAPTMTVTQLFSEVLIDPDDYEGWQVGGQGLGELAVWTRPSPGKGNGGARKEHLAQAQAQESETQGGKKVWVLPLTSTSIPLIPETLGFIDERVARDLPKNGSLVFYEYLFEPIALHSEGEPISIYLTHKVPSGMKIKSRQAEWAHDYAEKGVRLKSEGHYKKAVEFLQKANQAGDSNAAVELGTLFEAGLASSHELSQEFSQDFSQAAHHYQIAAAHGNHRAQELLNRPGFSDFVLLWQVAMGEHHSMPMQNSAQNFGTSKGPEAHKAQLKLAELYTRGMPWLEVNLEKASQLFETNLSWALKEADQGDVDAQFALGIIFAEGLGAPQDIKTATRWLETAIKKGHANAKNYLDDLGNVEKRADQLLKKLGIHLVKIEPKHKFMMGSPASESDRDSDETQHEVVLSPYEIQDSAVTQRLYVEIMGENPSEFKEEKYCLNHHQEIQVGWKKIQLCTDHPVEKASWEDVEKFLQKLNLKFKSLGYQFGLPSEAQQEYSIRGGTTTAYVSGPDDHGLGEFVSYEANSNSQTHAVRSKRANDYGFYRSSVWEWSRDWYGEYPKTSVTDPTGPSSGSGRVMRGCSWFSEARDCRSAERHGDSPGARDADLGFRLSRTH